MVGQASWRLVPPFGLVFAVGVLVGAATSGLARNGATEGLRPETAHATRYPAEVIRIIDGDTFEARVRVWPGLELTTKVRLRGIDAPELQAHCTEERMRAEAARAALATLLAQGNIGIAAVGLDKFGGRVLASASTAHTADVGAALLEAGLARPYRGRRQRSCVAGR